MDCGDIIMKKEKSNLSFWFKQSKGLMLINPNENLVEVYKKKSKSALNMLISAIEKEELDWILDISYYAKYFIVYAVFMKAGIKSEIHDCTISALKRLFVDEKIIGRNIYDELEKSKELRVGALYYDEDFVEAAGECGYRSILILLGALDSLDLKPEILSYEGPFGVGYLVANYHLSD